MQSKRLKKKTRFNYSTLVNRDDNQTGELGKCDDVLYPPMPPVKATEGYECLEQYVIDIGIVMLAFAQYVEDIAFAHGREVTEKQVFDIVQRRLKETLKFLHAEEEEKEEKRQKCPRKK